MRTWERWLEAVGEWGQVRCATQVFRVGRDSWGPGEHRGAGSSWLVGSRRGWKGEGGVRYRSRSSRNVQGSLRGPEDTHLAGTENPCVEGAVVESTGRDLLVGVLNPRLRAATVSLTVEQTLRPLNSRG